ncbi:hypothetical protein Q8F55_006395 [Vanrija albida]|uniref:Uncharacterized protein n=1 Tax=Vanrija albida TaxID=181172 RepID=A0ABR3PX86_9TREE
MAPVPTAPELAFCAAQLERTRITDLLILCFGIGIGVLFFAIAHDVFVTHGGVCRGAAGPRRCRHARALPVALFVPDSSDADSEDSEPEAPRRPYTGRVRRVRAEREKS